MLRRRTLLAAALAAAARPAMAATAQLADAAGLPLAPWRPGTLDIHHISTGRGDAALVVRPDGRTLLIDTGASASSPAATTPARPDGGRNVGEWVGRYVLRRLSDTGGRQIDHAVASHIHPDHVGDPAVGRPDPRGFVVTGLSAVADVVPISVLIDRGAPDYDVPAVGNDPTWQNHRRWVAWRRSAGERVERIRVGDAGQFAPVPAAFEIMPLAANGRVWTGRGHAVRDHFGAARDIDENPCSIALRIRHGGFSYFTGGDLVADTDDGARPWRDVEYPAVQACGPVDVAVAPHHGMFDTLTARDVRTLRPAVWIVQGWHAAHPGMLQLERMFSRHLYARDREVFATGLTEASRLTNGRLVRRMAATDGHVIVRVDSQGATFRVVVTSNRDEQDRVSSVHGPFATAG